MKKYAVKREDGGVTILMVMPETTNQLILRDAKAVEGYVSHYEVQDSDMPKDFTFRDAWTLNQNNKFEVDMPKARTIHMNKLRDLRTKVFPKMDEQYLKADEEGNQQLKKEIADKKKALRDMPATFDLSKATTPEDLKKLIPELLKTEG